MVKTVLLQDHEGWIPKGNCKDRFLYRIHSRNLAFGVFRAATGGFIGLRTKFDSIFAFEEYHWDNGPPHGTVKPKELLESLPGDIVLNTDLGVICANCYKTCAYINFLDGPHEKELICVTGEKIKVDIQGAWKHTEPSDCIEIIACNAPNDMLEKWLHEMEKKYVSDYSSDWGAIIGNPAH